MNTLPEGFAELAPFVDQWAAPTTSERAALRDTSSPEAKQAFFDTIGPRVDEALAMLDTKPVDQLDKAEQNLMNMLLSFAHISLAVEIHGARSEGRHVQYRQFMRITRSPADEGITA